MKRLLLFTVLALTMGNAGAQALSQDSDPDPVRPGNFALRTNLLYDALLTPTLGFEWRMSDNWGLKLDGSYGYWGGKFGKIHNVWLVSPEIRRYMGEPKRFYMGLGANMGGYDIYKLGPVAATFPDDTGYKGTLWNGGLVLGYQAKLSRSFSLDFNVGLGYTHLKYDAFTMARCESCTYKEYKEKSATKNFFGPTQAGISLIWHFGKPKTKPVSDVVVVPPPVQEARPEPKPEVKPEEPQVVKEVRQEVKLVMIEVSNTLFAFDSYELNSNSKAELGRVVSWLKEHPEVRAVIEGHTDNKGTAAYNQKLSENRAKSVYDYFVSQGVVAQRLSYKGYGLTRPVTENSTAKGRQQNRRVEIKVME